MVPWSRKQCGPSCFSEILVVNQAGDLLQMKWSLDSRPPSTPYVTGIQMQGMNAEPRMVTLRGREAGRHCQNDTRLSY